MAQSTADKLVMLGMDYVPATIIGPARDNYTQIDGPSLAYVGVPFALAVEIGRQINAATYDADKLMALGMPYQQAAALYEGAGYSAEATALFARITATPTDARKVYIDRLIAALKTAGVWTKLDAFYILAAADSQAAGRNWVADQYNLTAVSAPTFAADRGYTGNGTSAYVNTQFTPSTQATKASQNSTTAFGWSRTSGNQPSGGLFGDAAATPLTYLYPRDDDFIGARLNSATSLDSGAGASLDGSGLWLANRSASGSFTVYRNDVQKLTGASVSSGLSSATIKLLQGFSGDFYAGQIAAFGYGASLTTDQMTALYSALSAYMTAVGAV